MEITFFQGLWFLLIFVLIAGYFVLDGFDLGAGVLYPFVAKNDKEKAVVRTSIGPVWDGNEVWLLTAGGALFAAFPAAYATTFSGFYLAVMLVLFGLIVRAVSVEYRGHDLKWAKVWDICFFIGSLLPALLLGVAVGNIFAGIPMSANGDYAGVPLLGLITPFTLLCGLLGLSMFLTQGASWLALKAPKPSDMQARVAKLRFPLQIVSLVLFVAVTAFVLMGVQPAMDPMLGAVRWVLAILFVAAIVVSVFFAKKKDCDLGAFIAQSGAAALLVLLLAASMFPNFVFATADSIGPAITAMNASSSELTLMWMTIITCVGLPLVLIYHVIIYRTFRGRVKDEDLAHY
ncbi:cytochrome d ubiquinol oxidase subunit II [Eggerthella sinensis]|jgi:cytochrome bd ubiquinol oxidase subunit II|uniref:Cytochrome d ubiquinol oxidase subunit II n=1 Tax=Eggerthella sinensis TaxID=242230 RepID=A0A3N0IZ08_9ACTN|nr:cytochrome d ubiquinol oxidase subunit II [Eggerthella sinensis]MCB7036442.1 cytochrome d ubiquinol oxidase subunit II [Eggerthella sinensis]RDB66751.1 cytochrome d ubiquinol oxidase subunit II [Eggerthella sinensis]RNM42137.1 cytochrome d ubiquinol oxidase subunit II [Eggerthella sinensis]